MICRAKGCKNFVTLDDGLCEAHHRERQHNNAHWQGVKADRQAKRDLAREIVLEMIAKRRENGPKLCAAKVKKGTMDCHFHATHGNFCFIHKSLAEG